MLTEGLSTLLKFTYISKGQRKVYKYQFSQGNVLRKVKEEKVSLSYINREGSFFFNLIGYEFPKPKFPQG